MCSGWDCVGILDLEHHEGLSVEKFIKSLLIFLEFFHSDVIIGIFRYLAPFAGAVVCKSYATIFLPQPHLLARSYQNVNFFPKANFILALAGAIAREDYLFISDRDSSFYVVQRRKRLG